MSCKYCGFSGTNEQMIDHAGEMCGAFDPPEHVLELAAKDAQIKKLKDALAAMVEAYGPVHDDELSAAEIEARDHGEYVLWELNKKQLEGER